MPKKNQGIPVVGPLLNKMFGTRNERFVKRYTSRVEAINGLEAQTRALTDAQLRGKIHEFRERWDKGEQQDALLVEAFAVAREAMDRAVGIRSIFNPEKGFDPSVLPAAARALYDEVKTRIDQTPTVLPRTLMASPAQMPQGEPDVDDHHLGHAQPVPSWRTVEIPNALYEAVRELYPESRPPFRARPFDVQLIGGMVLSGGKIAEMKTGEGKTIVAPLACYLACIEHLQVHVVTVNDYLVQRDRDWTYPFFHALGLTVGAIHPAHVQPEEYKRWMYRCDVVYGTTAEFGFDYLRDNMKPAASMQVQRHRQLAIVDEVDSILIDEARTPLIISGQAHDDQPRYELADRLARHLVEKQRPWSERDEAVQRCKETIKGLEGDTRQARDKSLVPELQKRLEAAKRELPELERERDQHVQYFEVEMDRKQSHLTHDGVAEAQRVAGVGSFYVDQNMDIPHLLEQSLRGHVIYKLDRDYVVMEVPDRMTGRTDPSVVIVDTNTGRPMIGRQWSDGLHQAVEIKERVPVKPETQTVASITIQNFFKMYKRLAGMTGTADTEAQEFHDIYKLDVVSIPTNRALVRNDHADMVFLRGKDKWERIVDEIKTFHDVGRPSLVGTTSVEKSELVAQMLQRRHQIRHNVLNAKQHEKEADIIKNAGELGAVMIATNMAGRGTDIVLQKINREMLLEHWLRRGIASRNLTVDADEQTLREDVYRKVAQTELGLKKRDAESMAFEELELTLLRKLAEDHTWVDPKKIGSMTAEQLRDELDKSGRCLLHRIRWYETIEQMGGLHVIGTERHESRRIDNQLRGRSGRQGDRGSSRFYVALDDDLMKMFAGETTMKILGSMGMKEGDAIESAMLSKRIEGAQRKVEERNFQVRKNILEYDEIMEHQRQFFYGQRQRVLEGRDVRGLIFEYIGESVKDAVEEYLDPEYAAQCVAEFARDKLDCSIPADRLRGKDAAEMGTVIRRLAKDDARSMIDVTLGEYIHIEGSEVSVDFDSAGLINWAKSRFGVEIDAAELREGGAKERRHVQDLLVNAAEEKIDQADLSGINPYLETDYGLKKLVSWSQTKFGVAPTLAELDEARKAEDGDPAALILKLAREAYREREIQMPVEVAMQQTMQVAREAGPERAIERLAEWAKLRFGVALNVEELKRTPPNKVGEKMRELSREAVDSGRLAKLLDEALQCNDITEFDAWLQKHFGMNAPEEMRFLDDAERANAIRARVETIVRGELLQLEQAILLNIFDSTWKDHLYQMDQLRDSIGYRAFSQQDPRIEYKREGSKLFVSMNQSIRDKVTDLVFRARFGPGQGQGQNQGQPQQRPQAPRPSQTGVPAGSGFASSAGLYTPPAVTGTTRVIPPAGAGAGSVAAQQSGTEPASDQASDTPAGDQQTEQAAPTNGVDEQARSDEAARAAAAQDRNKPRTR